MKTSSSSDTHWIVVLWNLVCTVIGIFIDCLKPALKLLFYPIFDLRAAWKYHSTQADNAGEALAIGLLGTVCLICSALFFWRGHGHYIGWIGGWSAIILYLLLIRWSARLSWKLNGTVSV